MSRKLSILFLITCASVIVTGCQCSREKSSSGISENESPEAKLAARGKTVYLSNCVACHSPNPKAQGSLGPEVYGSSKELLTARMLHASYPEGYKPKRESHAMPALPHLAPEIDALSAYLNAP